VTRAHRPRFRAGPLLAETRRLLRRAGLSARKGLGQHFLVDEAVLQTIVRAADLTPEAVVVEVGPGLGILTRELASRAGHVIAVELDGRLAALLRESLSPFVNTTVITGDILNTDTVSLLDCVGAESYKVVANLPYYVASAVLRHFLEASRRPESMVVMVQKEVAEVITAVPGRMSVLSVAVQVYGRPQLVATVPARCFYPPPEVDSAILKIDVYAQPRVPPGFTGSFFRLVRAGFSASRKQLPNSLAQGLGVDKADALSLLEKAGIEARRRAETLTLEDWVRLWEVYSGTHR